MVAEGLEVAFDVVVARHHIRQVIRTSDTGHIGDDAAVGFVPVGIGVTGIPRHRRIGTGQVVRAGELPRIGQARRVLHLGLFEIVHAAHVLDAPAFGQTVTPQYIEQVLELDTVRGVEDERPVVHRSAAGHRSNIGCHNNRRDRWACRRPRSSMPYRAFLIPSTPLNVLLYVTAVMSPTVRPRFVSQRRAIEKESRWSGMGIKLRMRQSLLNPPLVRRRDLIGRSDGAHMCRKRSFCSGRLVYVESEKIGTCCPDCIRNFSNWVFMLNPVLNSLSPIAVFIGDAFGRLYVTNPPEKSPGISGEGDLYTRRLSIWLLGIRSNEKARLSVSVLGTARPFIHALL